MRTHSRARTYPHPSTYQFRLGALQKFFHVLRAWSQAPRSGAAKALRGKGGQGLRTGATGRKDELPLCTGGQVPAPRPARTRGEPREQPYALIREVGVAPGAQHTPARPASWPEAGRAGGVCGWRDSSANSSTPLRPSDLASPKETATMDSSKSQKTRAGVQGGSQGWSPEQEPRQWLASLPHEVPPSPAPLEPAWLARSFFPGDIIYLS